ncbi:hypothetical protein P3L51_05025 [Streptomyces sp. PSRA5]|uniref:hypothetical protein n=1 Tax=Streptomyces panacea TaxID=3035064 RepID=UPI00339D1AC7
MSLKQEADAVRALRLAPDAVTDPDSSMNRLRREKKLEVTTAYSMFADATRHAVNDPLS